MSQKQPLEAKFMKGNSWLWKGFVEGVNFINEKVGKIRDNGANIYVWNFK